MINVKKLPASLNTDDDARVLQPSEVLNVENMRVGVSADGKNFQIRNFPSTQLIFEIAVPYNNLSIGTAKDFNRQRIIWFAWNDNEQHAIHCYEVPTDTHYIVLLSSQTADGFNWERTSRIDKNARVIGDLLFYTDNLNEPQCVNIEAGIKLNQPSYNTTTDPYQTPIKYQILTLIKRPPTYPLQVAKITDSGFPNNYIQNNAYQFCYRYWSKYYMYSALSSFSQLEPFNSASDTFNAITVALSFDEQIDKDTQQVDLVVRYGNFGKSFVIRSWNKDNYYDDLAIKAHNQNAVALGITFYDNQVGIALDDVTANTSFHNVARLAKTLEDARNRLFLANLLKGYNTPTTTSLSVSLGTINTGGAGTYTAAWKYFYLQWINTTNGSTGTIPFYYAYYGSINPTSYYYLSQQSPTPPVSVNASAASRSWATEIQLAADIRRNTAAPVGTIWDIFYPFTFYDTGSTTQLIYTVDVGNLQFFKSSASYRVSIAFYDRFRRKTGVVDKDISVTIPDRTYAQSVFNATINWALSNADAANEIPVTAYYYQIHITRNRNEIFFEQIWCINTNYAFKATDGTITYNTTFVDTATYAVAFDVNLLFTAGLGYVFTEGDLLRMYKSDNTNVLFNVIGQDGNYVLCAPKSIGTLGAAVGFLIEIYTPYKPSTTEPYFETGYVYDIVRPGKSNRTYGTLSGSINGDCYAIQRDKGGSSLYFVEAMSPNDKVWQIWQTDRGWINLVDKIGEQIKETAIDFSDTYINGTKTNGLNVFQPLNTKDVGNSSGAITKLQLTNKQTEDGTVMLVITETDHLSAYLQEVQLVSAVQNAFIAASSEVIGTINALKNGKGSINPESVEEYQGVVWGISALNGSAWQYSNDGVIDISDYKGINFFERFCHRYIAQGLNSSNNPIHSVYDPSSDELLFVLPATEDESFQPDLPSYDNITPDYTSSIKNRFDFYDGQAKIVIFKAQQNKWVGAYQYIPDCMSNLGNKLFGLSLASLYLFNENLSSFNTVFGVQYPQRICIAGNTNPSVIADLFDIALESNKIPNYSVAYTKLPDEQITDLTDSNYVNKEGVQVARWFRDRLSPNASGTADEKMYAGDVLKSNVPLIMLEFKIYDEQLILFSINLGFEVSVGTQQILQSGK